MTNPIVTNPIVTNIVRFPAARLCLLRVTGELVDVVGEPADAEGLRYLTISRGFCRHALFRAPPGAGRRVAANAARMHAEMHCPFAGGDWLLTPAAGGVAIWWWDARAVRAAIGERWVYDPAAIVPETLLEPRGDGWRQMVTVDGHDLQLWSGGAVVASYWRRQAFDATAWSTLAMGLPPGVTLPDDIPAPAGLRLAETVRRPPDLPRDPGWSDLTKGAVAASVLALVATGWFSGRAMAYDRAAEKTATQSAQWSETGAPRNRAIATRIATLRRIATLSAQPDPVPAIAAAFVILNRAGTSASAWRIDRDGVRLTLDEKPARATPREIAIALERDPMFSGVSAQRTGEKGITFEAALTAQPLLQPQLPPSLQPVCVAC